MIFLVVITHFREKGYMDYVITDFSVNVVQKK